MQMISPQFAPVPVRFHDVDNAAPPPRGGGYFGNFWVGGAAGTLEPLAYTRVSSAESCYPILE